MTPPKKAAFQGTAVGNGRVNLVAKVPVKHGVRIFYAWQMSTDNGKTWIALPSTNDAFTAVAGLTPANYVWFQYRYTTNNTPSTWSAHIEVLVA